jgi:D-glycerate 3-kinase
MKAMTGGKGMTDEQVNKFVDRYIPGYHFFGAGVLSGGHDPQTGAQLSPPWLPKEESPDSSLKYLRVTIDENREVVKVSMR